MVSFSKNSQLFLESADDSLGNPGEQTTPIPADASRMIPGRIIIFRYYLGSGIGSRNQKVVLIVGCKRGIHGTFQGKTGILVSCLKLTSETIQSSDAVLESIAQNLYNRERVAVYGYFRKHKRALTSLVGRDVFKDMKNSFRTYKLNKMGKVYRLNFR
jgi:hypothetical protein